MPPIGKELGRAIDTPESLAVREVESYIEKVEKSTESTIKDNQNNQVGNATVVDQVQGNKTLTPLVTDPNLKKIVLPLTEGDIVQGFKGNVFQGIRWLSEWCVMMIKKYPGRVFYSTPKEQGYD